MRKVLFATTALVALGGVSAASADISVGGKASWTMTNGSGDGYATDSQSYATTVDFGISGSSTLDNGMTVAGGLDLHEATGAIDDSGFTVSGDFGTLGFGGYAEAAFGAMAIDVTADEGNAFAKAGAKPVAGEYGYALPGDEYIDHSDVSLKLPAISGATIMVGMSDGATDSADGTQAGISYTMDAGGMGVTVAYAASSTGETNSDDSQVAAKVTAGDATITVISGETGEFSNSGVGVTYALNDALTIQAYTGSTERDTNAAYEVKDTGVGFTYTVTPGMSISVTSNDWSGKNGTAADAESGTTTKLALDVTF